MKKLFTTFLLLFISLTLVGCNNDNPDPLYDDIIFSIIGDEVMSLEFGDSYIEHGFLAKQGKTDISDYVDVENNIIIFRSGTYEVTYTLDYEGIITKLTRTVNILHENTDCSVIDDTDLLECYKVWSSYLHTTVSLKLYIQDEVVLDSDAVYDEVERIIAFYNDISDKYTLYPGVINVKTINDNPDLTHIIDEELFDLIEFSLDHQSEVDNIFNIALGPVIKVWHNYREECNTGGVCAIPTLAELELEVVYTDPSKIVMDRENLSITMEANMSIDLGGVSKGYISRVIIDYLDSLDLSGYLLNNGESNISLGGTHPTRDSGDFLIAVTDPTRILPYYATVFLGDGEQLVTSGDYQQYFVVDGEIYHHIISGDSLFPDRHSRSVSIVFDDPALSDLYSTAIFLMTITDGIEFVDSIDGLEAIWFGLDGTVFFSENFESEYLSNLYE